MCLKQLHVWFEFSGKIYHQHATMTKTKPMSCWINGKFQTKLSQYAKFVHGSQFQVLKQQNLKSLQLAGLQLMRPHQSHDLELKLIPIPTLALKPILSWTSCLHDKSLLLVPVVWQKNNCTCPFFISQVIRKLLKKCTKLFCRQRCVASKVRWVKIW